MNESLPLASAPVNTTDKAPTHFPAINAALFGPLTWADAKAYTDAYALACEYRFDGKWQKPSDAEILESALNETHLALQAALAWKADPESNHGAPYFTAVTSAMYLARQITDEYVRGRVIASVMRGALSESNLHLSRIMRAGIRIVHAYHMNALATDWFGLYSDERDAALVAEIEKARAWIAAQPKPEGKPKKVLA